MRWLRFARFATQYINTGIKPSAGYKIKAKLRFEDMSGSTRAVFGSRNTSGGADSSSFNVFLVQDADLYFRTDYGKAGAKKFMVDNTLSETYKYFDITLGATSYINGESDTGGTLSGNNYPIFIGTINGGGTPDSRVVGCDFGEFTIYNASDEVVFDGVPVKAGSTEYKASPAPSNCFYDKVSGNYFTNAGAGILGYEDDSVEQSKVLATSSGMDYGVKMLSAGDDPYEIMNAKYRLFGADLSSNKSEFKSYEIVLTGYSPDPVVSWPAYIEDWNHYTGDGVRKVERLVIDTGFDPKTIKSIFVVSPDDFTSTNYQARAHQYQLGINGNYDTYLVPNYKDPPQYSDVASTQLIMLDKDTREYPMSLSGQSFAGFNTMGQFNGGSITQIYWNPPEVYFKLDNDGKLRISTSIPYNWVQMAGPGGYRVRWRDWCWYQGVKFTITILSTPYII